MSKQMIRTIVIDDSAFIRRLLADILDSAPDIEVVATAVDVQDARQKIKQHNPDVVTLDIEMPGMDGIAFLEKIMTLRPMPVVMVSTLTKKGAEATLRCLEIGAVDYIPKPEHATAVNTIRQELIAKVRAAARANIRPSSVAARPGAALQLRKRNAISLVAIGASTGGVEALREVIPPLPSTMPPVVIVQHMPEKFTEPFANRLNGLSTMTVSEARDGDRLEDGHAYIAPGGKQLALIKRAGAIHCELQDGPPVSSHKPSVDFTFDLAADIATPNMLAVMLTGMGKDGANGMLKIRDKGGKTLGQNEDSCVVYGMPKAARMNGAVEKEVPLSRMAQAIVNACTA